MKLTKEQKITITRLLNKKRYSHRFIAEIALGRSSRKSTVSDFAKSLEYISPTATYSKKTKPSKITSIAKAVETVVPVIEYKGPKILVLDVETSASVVYSFSRFKAFIKPDQVIQEPYMLTFAAKWLHSPVMFDFALPDYDNFKLDVTDDSAMMADIWKVLDEADIIIAHNAKFDYGYMNQRFVKAGILPPSPYKIIDTLREIKQAFTLPARSLAAACNYFETENRKLDNAGWSLWQRCMEGDATAFEEMRTYNRGDIYSLEDLYLKVRPYMRTHPNVGLYHDDSKLRCPHCGSEHLEIKIGKSYYTNMSSFDVYQCTECGGNARGRTNQRSKSQMVVTKLSV